MLFGCGLIVLAVILCLLIDKAFNKWAGKMQFKIIKGVIMIALMILALCAAVNSSYAPYIYGNF